MPAGDHYLSIYNIREFRMKPGSQKYLMPRFIRLGNVNHFDISVHTVQENQLIAADEWQSL